MKKSDRNGIKYYDQNRLEVDCVIFNLDNDSLKILLVKNIDDEGIVNWRLANDYIKQGETIASTAQTILKRHTGSDRYYIEQLKAFGYSPGSTLQESISIAYYGLIKSDHNVVEKEQSNTDVKWVNITEIEDLDDKDKVILDFSLKELRRNICQSTIGFNLLPEKFTLLQVVHLYEKILGIEINKSNFRRKILQLGLVQNLNEKEENVSHRAARFYKLKLQFQEIVNTGDFNFVLDKNSIITTRT